MTAHARRSSNTLENDMDYVIYSRMDRAYYRGAGRREGRRIYLTRAAQATGTVWTRVVAYAEVFDNRASAEKFAKSFAELQAEPMPLRSARDQI